MVSFLIEVIGQAIVEFIASLFIPGGKTEERNDR